MFKKTLLPKNILSLFILMSYSIVQICCNMKIINNKNTYSKLNAQYNLRNLLQNETSFNNNNNKKEEITEYQKHISLIILIAIIIASLAVFISIIFLIKFIYKRCKKKKEEVTEKGNEKDVNYSKRHKKKMSYEMRTISSRQRNFLRSSTPMKKNKTFSLNPLSKNYFKIKNIPKLNIDANNEDKIINNNDNEQKNESQKNNEYSQYTFRTNSDIKEL